MTDTNDKAHQPAKRRRRRTQAEWDAVTGGLVEARTLAEAHGSRGVFRIELRRYERVPAYLAGSWWKPDDEGRLRPSRGRTIAVQLPDVGAFARAWAEAAEAASANSETPPGQNPGQSGAPERGASHTTLEQCVKAETALASGGENVKP